jgi:cytochrome c-type biogenesis protein CcmH/NrfF
VKRVGVIAFVLAATILVVASGPIHAQPLLRDVEKDLRCPHGCDMDFIDCDCEVATEIRAAVTGMIENGRTKPQIIDDLLAEWGEVVLLSYDPGTAVAPIEVGTSESVTYPDVDLPGPDPGTAISIPDGDIAIVDPGPRADAPLPDTAAAFSAPGGGSSNMMTWLVPVLSAAGGASVVLVVHLLRRRQAWELSARQADRRQQGRRSKRSSRR